MPSAVLFFAYVLVMAAGLFCFVRAFQVRRDTPRHKRWALTGTALALGGVVVVLVAWRVLDWQVAARSTQWVRVHRALAYAATGTLLFVAVSGARRWAIHTRLYWVFFPLYAAALATALVAYQP